MLLTGTFVRTLDEKLRVALPKRLRDRLLEGEEQSLHLAPGTDGCLALYNERVLTALGERVAMAAPNQHDVRAYGRLFYARAEPVELDAQGRLRIPAELAKLAALATEVVLLGVRDHVEIWDRERWESYLKEQQPRFDEVAERAIPERR